MLVHEYPADLCGSWPFADYLAKQGVVSGRVVDDVAAAVAELRRRGVTEVELVDASMGGAAVLIAGTRVQPQSPRWSRCRARPTRPASSAASR